MSSGRNEDCANLVPGLPASGAPCWSFSLPHITLALERPATEMTVSRKRAKSRTPGRKPHSTVAKARGGRARKTRADLEQQLKACRREIAHARERLAEAMKQQTATSEMLRIISNAPIQSVLDAVAENAARLCDANNTMIWRPGPNPLRLVAAYGESSATIHGREGLPVTRDPVTGRAACDRRTIHVHDLAAEEREYPVGSSHVKAEGWHTTLATPLLREGTLLGIILVQRTEVRPFDDRQIALLETFADEAVIAIENVRLFEAEKQRTLALAHANRDLAEREAKIRRLVDSNIIGIFIWDFDGHILEANDAFLRIVGYDRDDLVAGRVRWTDLTPPEWRDADARLIEEHKMSGRLPPFEKEYFGKNGSRVPVLIGVATFDGPRDQGVAFVLDLTERKEAEENLRESERRYRDVQAELAHVTRVTTLGELSASIAHEVNQPLAAVLANAEACLLWLGRETPNLDKARRSVEWIINDGSRAGAVIQGIRALAKRTNIQREPLRVNDVIGDVISLLQREMFSHRVSLRKELASALPTVFADRIQLQQVIVNLMINSMEAMQSIADRPRELTIRSRRDGANQLRLTVEDCGVGISAENVERLFSPFFTTKPTGMGMGLSICRSIIEAHGGRLWAVSNLPHGAAFHFTLPLRQEETS